jgi:ketosteroid isomerase-like protein
VPVDEGTLEALAEAFAGRDLKETVNDEAFRSAARELLEAVATPDLEIAMVGPGGFTGSCHGVDGVEEAWRDWLEPFASYRIEPEADLRRSGDAVVLFARQIATPKGSGQPMTNDGAMVFFLEGDRVRRVEFHLDRDAALRSAGLGE